MGGPLGIFSWMPALGIFCSNPCLNKHIFLHNILYACYICFFLISVKNNRWFEVHNKCDVCWTMFFFGVWKNVQRRTVPQVNSIPWKSSLNKQAMREVMRAELWRFPSPLQTNEALWVSVLVDVELIQSYCINWVFMIDDVRKKNIFVLAFCFFVEGFVNVLELFLKQRLEKACPSGLHVWFHGSTLIVFQSQPWQRLAFAA